MISANQRRLKVGVLTPHAAAGPEIEIPEMSQGRVTVPVARIRSPENAAGTESTGAPTALRALTRPEAVDGDAAGFGDGSVDVVAHASTTTGYVLGVRSEAELLERPAAKCAVPVVGSAGAAATRCELVEPTDSFWSIRRGSTTRSIGWVSATSATRASTSLC